MEVTSWNLWPCPKVWRKISRFWFLETSEMSSSLVIQRNCDLG